MNVHTAGSVTELKSHFSICVASSEEVNDEFIEIDDDDFEEYEWAGQKRIRSTSLFMGGLKAAGFQTITKTNKDEVLDVINVHDDGIGSAQYHDKDLLSIEDEVNNTTKSIIDSDFPTRSFDDPGVKNSSYINQQSSMCKICMCNYTDPLTSTICWHVHCEKCWMLALGTKKLCPQCKTIVTPSDLRKIFL